MGIFKQHTGFFLKATSLDPDFWILLNHSVQCFWNMIISCLEYLTQWHIECTWRFDLPMLTQLYSIALVRTFNTHSQDLKDYPRKNACVTHFWLGTHPFRPIKVIIIVDYQFCKLWLLYIILRSDNISFTVQPLVRRQNTKTFDIQLTYIPLERVIFKPNKCKDCKML